MSVISRILFVGVCFFAAIACYLFGVPAGGTVFLILGLIFEMLCWIGIFGKKRKISSSSSK